MEKVDISSRLSMPPRRSGNHQGTWHRAGTWQGLTASWLLTAECVKFLGDHSHESWLAYVPLMSTSMWGWAPSTTSVHWAVLCWVLVLGIQTYETALDLPCWSSKSTGKDSPVAVRAGQGSRQSRAQKTTSSAIMVAGRACWRSCLS